MLTVVETFWQLHFSDSCVVELQTGCASSQTGWLMQQLHFVLLLRKS